MEVVEVVMGNNSVFAAYPDVRWVNHGINEIKKTSTAIVKTIFENKVRAFQNPATAQIIAIKPSAFDDTSSQYIVPKTN